MPDMPQSIRRWLGPLETIWQDISIGRRMLARTPGFTAVAVATMALGIGANVLIFSLVNAVLLRPLPYLDAGRLAGLTLTSLRNNTISEEGATIANYLDWRSQKYIFQEVAAYRVRDCTLVQDDQPEIVACGFVSASLFPLLGIRPWLGRPISQEEDRFGGEKVALLTYRLFHRRFGGNPGVVGQRMIIDAEAYTIIGVLPEEFVFPGREEIDLLKPLAARHPDPGGPVQETNIIARLQPGISFERAQADMNVPEELIARFRIFKNVEARIRPLRAGLVSDSRTPLLILLGAVGLVLLIACVNVANLLLARGATRQKEIAIRLSLGAGRSRVLRQLLIESALLSLTGGALGLAIAYVGIEPIKTLAPVRIPLLSSASIDGWVLAFTLAASLANGLLAGLTPAVTMSKVDLTRHLKEGTPGGGSAVPHRRARTALVIAELSLAMILLAGASLLLKTLWRLAHTDSGFDARTAIMMDVQDPPARDGAQRVAYVEAALARIGALPGVEASGAMGLSSGWDTFTIPGQPPVAKDQMPTAAIRAATPGAFRASGMRLVAGRFFETRDGAAGPAVAIVNQALARRFFSGQNPVGREIEAGQACVSCHVDPSGQDPVGRQIRRAAAGWPLSGSGKTARVIVGVVGNTRFSSLDREPVPEIYLPFAEGLVSRSLTFVSRFSGPQAPAHGGAGSAMRAAVRDADRAAITFPPQTIEERLSGTIAPRRVNAIFLGSFAALALLLAAVGVYGVLSYTVSVRTHEFGIRMTLGARREDLTRMVLREAAGLIATGLAIGLAGALALTRLLRALLYGVAPSDAVSLIAASLLLAAVALAASYLPAWRAARVEPLPALRSE